MRPQKQARCDHDEESFAGSPSASLFASFVCSDDAQMLQECAESILEDLDASQSLLSGMFKSFLRDANIKPAPKHHSGTCSPRHGSLQAKRARDTEMPLKVTLEDLYNGAVKSVPIQRGKHDGRRHIVPVQEQLQVHVQPGLKSGIRITLPGQGNEDCCGMPADLTFIVQQQLHPAFRRLRDDLYAIVNVPLVTALTGGPISLRTLSGQLLQLPVEDIITPGSELVLPNLGMPVFGDQQGRRGSLHVRFNVQFPEQLSRQQQLQLKTTLSGCDNSAAGEPSAGLSAQPGDNQQCCRRYHQQQQQQQIVALLRHSKCDVTRWLEDAKQRQQQEQCTLAVSYSSSPSCSSSYAYAGSASTGNSSAGYGPGSSSAFCSSSIAGLACMNTTSSSRDPGRSPQQQ